MGLPGLNGFIGEVLSLIGMFRVQPTYAIVGALGMILGAWYLLLMLQQVLFGPPRREGHNHAVPDLNLREVFALAPIAAACLVIGVYPQPLLRSMEPEVKAIASIYMPYNHDVLMATSQPARQAENN
jgi:NADH-quinone oxidoreductase subunit M